MVAVAQPRDPGGEWRGLVEEVGDEVIAALADGCNLKTAAECAGLAYSTVQEWFARAEGTQQRGAQRGDPDGIYAAWAARARKARGQVLRGVTLRLVKGENAERKGEHNDLCNVQAANDRFILERRAGWRREDKHEHEVTQGPSAPQIFLED